MPEIPTGNVTFLFTDIEGSTQLAYKNPEKLKETLELHDNIVNSVILLFNGYVFKTAGDAFYIAFAFSTEAVIAAVEIQRKIKNELNQAGIRVRMGIHTGEAEWTGTDYSGYLTLSRVQRIMSAAHGGQIIVSENVYCSAIEKADKDISFIDLGERRLKDLIRTEHVYQVLSPGIDSEFPPIKTPENKTDNLPAQTTSFIGRVNEIEEVKQILNQNRLITLHGSGGTGKTRLSIEVSSGMVNEFLNGVWFIELAHLEQSGYVFKEIASVLKSASVNEGEFINSLREKELLLILDNCEHLIEECARIVQSILFKCPKIKIITSSRTALKTEGENVYNVPTLSLPQTKKTISAEELMAYEAVRLFIVRAIAVKSDFSVNDKNASALAELCMRLDGIPLAIELAAARVRVLTIEKILEKINDRFKILNSGSRSSLPRQQTLKALIDWSYDLLSEKEKLLFSRLSIFIGGWTLESAEEVCSDEKIQDNEILDLLSNLIDKSLVVHTVQDGMSRYTMLESIRHYGLEKIENEAKLHSAHYEYFLKICKEKESYTGADQIKWYKLIKNEHENLIAAINYYINDDPGLSLQLINEMSDAWEMNGIISEGFERYKILFKKMDCYEKQPLATGLMNAGFLASQNGDYKTSADYLYKSLEIEKSLDNKTNLANILNNIGNLHFLKEEMSIAKKFHEDALKIGYEINDKLTIGLSLVNIASINTFFGEIENTYQTYEEGLKMFRELGDKLSCARILSHLARLEFVKKNYEKALKYYEDCLPVLNEFGDHIVKSTSLLNMGNIYFSQKKFDETERIYEEVLAITKEFGYTYLYIHSLIKLAEVAHIKKNYEKAKDLLTESIKLCDREADKFKLSLCLSGFYDYYYDLEEFEMAAKILGMLETLNQTLGIGIKDHHNAKRNLTHLQMELGAERFDYLFNSGKNLEQKDAIELILKSN